MTSGSTVFEIRPARAWRRALLVLVAITVAAVLAWVAAWVSRGEGARAWLALPLLLPVVAAARWRDQARGRLVRDAGVWFLEQGDAAAARPAGELVVAVDLGRWMLLRWRPQGARWPLRSHWFALSRSDMPADWQAFRRAVYSPRPSPAGLSAQAPADPPA